jgi:protein O-mannosyl-transferase
MESTILPLEIVFEHRNYLPMAGLLLGCVATIAQILEDRGFSVVTALFAGLILAFTGLTAERCVDWSDPIRLALVTGKDHPNSPRSLYDAGKAIIVAAEATGKLDDSVRQKARAYFLRASALDKTNVYPATSAIVTGFHGKQVPKSAVDDLAFRLRNTPMFKSAPFLMLLTSLGNKTVSMAPEDVERLVTAALDNPDTSQGERALILNNYGRYLFVVQHDAQGAVSLTLAAAQMAPGNPFFQVNLTRLALALGQPEIAAGHLANARKWDLAGTYAQDIKELALQITEQKDRKGSKSETASPATKDGSLPADNARRRGA